MYPEKIRKFPDSYEKKIFFVASKTSKTLTPNKKTLSKKLRLELATFKYKYITIYRTFIRYFFTACFRLK